MIKQIVASIWILATTAAVMLGLNGSIAPAVMVVFSLAALSMFYGFALWTVISQTRKTERPLSLVSDSHVG